MKILHFGMIVGIPLILIALMYLFIMQPPQVNIYIYGIHTSIGYAYHSKSIPPMILGRPYNDSSIHISKGIMVVLHFINRDDDTSSQMDLNIDAFNVHTNQLGHLQSQTITFMADKQGTFTYYSNLHPEMKGTITVDPSYVN